MDSANINNEQTFDDSWLEKEDRANLIKHIKHLYDTKFGWADEALMKAMIKYHEQRRLLEGEGNNWVNR